MDSDGNLLFYFILEKSLSRTLSPHRCLSTDSYMSLYIRPLLSRRATHLHTVTLFSHSYISPHSLVPLHSCPSHLHSPRTRQPPLSLHTRACTHTRMCTHMHTHFSCFSLLQQSLWMNMNHIFRVTQHFFSEQ